MPSKTESHWSFEVFFVLNVLNLKASQVTQRFCSLPYMHSSEKHSIIPKHAWINRAANPSRPRDQLRILLSYFRKDYNQADSQCSLVFS